MKPILSTAGTLAVLIVVITAFVGCASTVTAPEVKKPPRTTLAALERDLKKAQAQLDATDDSLDEMTTAEQYDVEDAFRDFLENAGEMTALGEGLMDHVDAMESQGNDYFAYPAPQTALLDDQRRYQLNRGYALLREGARLMRRSYSPYRFDLSALRNSITTHRTPREVETVSHLIDKAKSDGESLKSALDRALDGINRSKSAMGPAAATLPPPSP